jgi:hypothetical protein
MPELSEQYQQMMAMFQMQQWFNPFYCQDQARWINNTQAEN